MLVPVVVFRLFKLILSREGFSSLCYAFLFHKQNYDNHQDALDFLIVIYAELNQQLSLYKNELVLKKQNVPMCAFLGCAVGN